MTKDEALKIAIEALQDNQHYIADNERHTYVMLYNEIIDKCKEALEQPAQDYVFICKRCGDDLGIEYVPNEQPSQGIELEWYNKGWTDANFEWQGLTDDEIEQAILSKNKAGEWWGMCLDIARAIEAKLKEKNT